MDEECLDRGAAGAMDEGSWFTTRMEDGYQHGCKASLRLVGGQTHWCDRRLLSQNTPKQAHTSIPACSLACLLGRGRVVSLLRDPLWLTHPGSPLASSRWRSPRHCGSKSTWTRLASQSASSSTFRITVSVASSHLHLRLLSDNKWKNLSHLPRDRDPRSLLQLPGLQVFLRPTRRC